jgi:hypothetical protein
MTSPPAGKHSAPDLVPTAGETMSTSDDPPSTYSEPEAALALRRAASLQLEAAERAERHLASGPGPSGDGYDREDLIAAAREVGIDPSFVSVALAELRTNAALATLDTATDRAATRWLGTRTRSVSASRRFNRPVEVVWSAIVRVCEGPDFGLRLDGIDGGHPHTGGVARFHMIRLGDMVTRRGSYTPLCFRMEQLEAWDLRMVLRVDGDATEVTMFLDLRSGIGRNLRWARASTGVLGILAGGAALAACLAAGPVIAAGMAVLGAGTGTGLCLAGWRWSYRSAAANLVGQLDELLAEVDRALRRDAMMLPGTDVPEPRER